MVAQSPDYRTAVGDAGARQLRSANAVVRSLGPTADHKNACGQFRHQGVANTGEVATAWGDVKLTPTTYLVDRKGRIVKRYVGEPDFTALHALIEKLLAEA
jgi:hypothetical protein